MSSATPTDLILRRGEAADAEAVAEVHLRARRAAPMPTGVRSDDEVRAWVATGIETDEVWVAELDQRPVGYLRLTKTWVDDLYVDPAHQGCGIGSALLELAKAMRSGGFGLWVFETNLPARAFYRRRGLVEVFRSDGSGNEEGEPDIEVRWPGVARSEPE